MSNQLFSPIRFLVLGVAILSMCLTGCQPEDEVQATPPPESGPEIPITTTSERARAAFLDGMYAFEVGDQQTAEEHFRSAVSIDPGFTYAYVHLSDVTYSPERYQKVVAKAVETSSDKSEGEKLLAQIRQTYITNDGDRRKELASALTDTYPESAYAWMERGAVHDSRGEVAPARAAWQKASSFSPQMIGSNVRLSMSYTFDDPRDLDQAVTFAQKAVSIAPDDAVLRVWLGDAYRGSGDLQAARQNYRDATERDETYGPAHVKLGHVLSFLGDYEAARASYDAGVEVGRGVGKAQLANYRAFVSLHEGDAAAAYDELSDVYAMIEAMELPDEEKTGVMFFTLTNQFLVAAHNDMMPEAEATLTQRRLLVEEASARTEDAQMQANMQTDAIYWDGYLAAVSGNAKMAKKAAAEYYERVKDQTDPQRFQAQHHLLGMVAMMEEDAASAVGHLSKADLSNIGIRFQLAQAHEQAGDADEAMRLYDEVARHNFNSVEYALVRADASKKRAS